MLEKHLTEEQLQRIAAGEEDQPGKLHMETCLQCQAKMQEYQLLFEGLQQQEAPVFDFDVTALVMDRLTTFSVAKKRLPVLEVIIVVTIITMLAVLVYLGRDLLGGVFRNSMSLLAYLALPAVILALTFFITDMNRQYQRNIKLLEG